MKKMKKVILTGMAAALLFTGNVSAAGLFGFGGSGRIEGDGFDSPEEAVTVYLDGLAHHDIKEMMSAFAVETYAENYDLERYLERMQAYIPTYNYIPTISDFSLELNIEQRRSDVIKLIRSHYLVLTYSDVVLGEDAHSAIPMEDSDSAEEFMDSLFVSDDTGYLDEIEFDGTFIDPVSLNEQYASENNRNNMANSAKIYNADELVSTACRFSTEKGEFLLCLDEVRYGKRWYLNAESSNIAILLGLDSLLYGMCPLTDDYIYDLLN